jgi:cytochrome c-type biogenesis protein
MVDISIWLAFLAGLASFLSPCVFSLIPAYIGYLSGRSVAANQGDAIQPRSQTVLHGVAFILGFSLVFMTMGLMMSAVGTVLYEARFWLAKVGGIIVIIFGIHMTGIFRIPFLDYDLHPQTPNDRRRGYFSSVLLGITFSAGWSPCIGPILGMILTLAINGGSIAHGMLLLTFYSVGLAIPFLIAAFGIGWVSLVLRKYSKVMHYVEIAMGVVMIAVGVLLFMGTFNTLGQYGFFVDFGL